MFRFYVCTKLFQKWGHYSRGTLYKGGHYFRKYGRSSDLKKFENSQPSSSNLKSFSRSLAQLFLTVGQNNFGKKIQFLKQKSAIKTDN